MPPSHSSVLKLYLCQFSDLCSWQFWLQRVKQILVLVHLDSPLLHSFQPLAALSSITTLGYFKQHFLSLTSCCLPRLKMHVCVKNTVKNACLCKKHYFTQLRLIPKLGIKCITRKNRQPKVSRKCSIEIMQIYRKFEIYIWPCCLKFPSILEDKFQ